MPPQLKMFLRAIELSGFSTWVRDSNSIWGYPTVLFLHTLGLAFVVGTSLTISIRILGAGSEVPIKPLDKLFPILWAGFFVNAVSGTILLAIDATYKLSSPIFWVKMACIALAVLTVQMTRNRVFRDRDAGQARPTRGAAFLAACSIALWMGAIIAGRLQAYFSTAHIAGSDS
jgi:hypothetical protein